VIPSKLPKGSSFFLFKEGIKPMFEDPKNKSGGRFFLDIKQEYVD
jgi:translation initiation factor 4E